MCARSCVDNGRPPLTNVGKSGKCARAQLHARRLVWPMVCGQWSVDVKKAKKMKRPHFGRRNRLGVICCFLGAASSSLAWSSSSALARRRPCHSIGDTLHGRRSRECTILRSSNQDGNKSSFLSTDKANVSFTSSSSSKSEPSNLSAIDRLILTFTSDRTSLLLGSVGLMALLINRLVSFPEEAVYEASRSRVDLLGVFAAGSVLLNGITKLDVESVQAEQVALEGLLETDVIWANEGDEFLSKPTVEWALRSFVKCSPARTAVLLSNSPDRGWVPLAMTGVLPSEPELRSSIPTGQTTPVLDRMLRDDGDIKGGTVGGAVGGDQKGGPKESYLPTLQALPGKVEFTYLPSNTQEALLLPVRGDEDAIRCAVVLGGDTAKSFAPRDVTWCREAATWIASER